MGDWIPMEKIRNLSLKKTILLYFVISLTAAFLLSGFTVHFARNMQNKIWEKYIEYADKIFSFLLSFDVVYHIGTNKRQRGDKRKGFKKNIENN